MFPNVASQMRTAFASMVSKTGSNSPGDVEMTCSTSEVAVCCSSASEIVVRAQLVEQSRVLDGDHGLGGEVRHQRDLLVGKGPHLLAKNVDSANQRAFLEHRHDDNRARAPKFGDRLVRIFRENIDKVDDVFNLRQATENGRRRERKNRVLP